ncbi:Golgi Transport [Umbelopsis sp. WA50703]
MWLTDAQKIGAGLTAFGTFFMFLGIMMLFDAGLMAIGNILFLSGITIIIGPRSTLLFFMRREKIRGTLCFLGGILLVFLRWPFVGFGVEIFGFLNLFGDFFPVIFGFLRRLPIIGAILSHPAVSRFTPRESRTRV